MNSVTMSFILLFILFFYQDRKIKRIIADKEDDAESAKASDARWYELHHKMVNKVKNLESAFSDLELKLSCMQIEDLKYEGEVSQLLDSLLDLRSDTTIDHVFTKFDVFYSPYLEGGKLTTFSCRFSEKKYSLRVFADLNKNLVDIFENDKVVFQAKYFDASRLKKFEIRDINKGSWFSKLQEINCEFENTNYDRYTRAA